MAQLPLSVYDKLTKRYRRFQVCGITCVIVCLLLIFAIPPFLNHQIVDLAIEQVILKEDNEKLWAHFPGDSQVEIVRNYTFFTLDN